MKLDVKQLRKAADLCIAGTSEACKSCPLRDEVDCSGELIRMLVEEIERMNGVTEAKKE